MIIRIPVIVVPHGVLKYNNEEKHTLWQGLASTPSASRCSARPPRRGTVQAATPSEFVRQGLQHSPPGRRLSRRGRGCKSTQVSFLTVAELKPIFNLSISPSKLHPSLRRWHSAPAPRWCAIPLAESARRSVLRADTAPHVKSRGSPQQSPHNRFR